jgi:hypothetical protein
VCSSDLKEGDQIQYTQASLNLEEMIGKFIFSSAEKDKEDDATSEAKKTDPFSADSE